MILPAQGQSVAQSTAADGQGLCPKPALSRVIRHRVTSGETLDSIAQRYNLLPTTLMGMNPALRGGKAAVGAEILVPPYNGIRIEVPQGQTWQDIAKTYRVRADVLFEVNGCQRSPRVVFVPGVNWSPNGSSAQTLAITTRNNYGLTSYPLPAQTSVILDYGWRLYPGTGQVAFHGGLDLAAPINTPVLSVGDGTVAFAGSQSTYGNLVVINHQAGRQTRYAHLSKINVKVGQRVRRGDAIGTTGSSGTPSSTAPHLHFEIRSASNMGWVAEDPNLYLPDMKVSRTP